MGLTYSLWPKEDIIGLLGEILHTLRRERFFKVLGALFFLMFLSSAGKYIFSSIKPPGRM